MKRLIALASVSAMLMWGQTTLAAANPPSSDKDKVSYSLGYEMGSNFKREKLDVDTNQLVSGLRTAMDGETATMTEKAMQEALVAFQKNMMKAKESEFKTLAKKNAAAGKAFLAANKAKAGVVTEANGLQYKVMQAGSGAIPKATDKVKVEYEGTTLTGEVFDSSYKRGKPVTFQVKGVIPAWSEALQKMNGKLFPFGIKHLLHARKHSKTVTFYLIGVHPEYQNKGVHAIIFNEFHNSFSKKGIVECIRTPELIENTAIQKIWKNFNPIILKKRCTFRKDV